MTTEMLPTEWVEDGFVYEAEYKYSKTLDKLNALTRQGRNGMISRMMLIGDMTTMCRSAVKNARKDSPLGLADVSILTRMNKKQSAYATAITEYTRNNEPDLFKRLFKTHDPLWNYEMACTICAFDEIMAKTEGQEVPEVMIDENCFS